MPRASAQTPGPPPGGGARPGSAARPGGGGRIPACAARKIKLSCNLYSFDAPLRSGEMSLEQVVDLCAELGFDAVDPTGLLR